MSPILFNAALEQAVASWKRRIAGCGLNVGGSVRLTNIRYADDIMLYATSLSELVTMLDILAEELHKYGLNINIAKTKIFCSGVEGFDLTTPLLVDTSLGFIEVLTDGSLHKYLGRPVSCNVRGRGEDALQHRIKCGWFKFRQNRRTLCSHNVSLKLRLKLFDCIVTPTILYGLTSTALTQRQMEQLASIRLKMLRNIVGWSMQPDDTWHDLGSRMKAKIHRAMQLYKVPCWMERLEEARWSLMRRTACKPHSWACAVCEWTPETTRARGRPRQRWTDSATRFLAEQGISEPWWIVARKPVWPLLRKQYVKFATGSAV